MQAVGSIKTPFRVIKSTIIVGLCIRSLPNIDLIEEMNSYVRMGAAIYTGIKESYNSRDLRNSFSRSLFS